MAPPPTFSRALYQHFWTNLPLNEQPAFVAFVQYLESNGIRDLERKKVISGVQDLWKKRKGHWLRKLQQVDPPPAPPPALQPAAQPVRQPVPPPGPRLDFPLDPQLVGQSNLPLNPELVSQPAPPPHQEIHNYNDWMYVDTIREDSIQNALGTPASGIYLQVRVNENGEITDRMVAKCIDLSQVSGSGRSKFQVEIDINELLAPKKCSHIVQYRGESITESRRSLYTDYCAGGDFYEFLQHYDQKNLPLPEHYIWYTWKCIVEALITLKTGNVCREPLQWHAQKSGAEASSSNQPWNPIIHMDIKTENIFLGNPDPKYPFYLRPLLADFDSSLILKGYDERLAGQKFVDLIGPEPTYHDIGTYGWYPPEQMFQVPNLRMRDPYNSNYAHDEPIGPGYDVGRPQVREIIISEQKDIWTVSLLIWHMVHSTLSLQWKKAKLLEMERAVRGGQSTDLITDDRKCPPRYSQALFHLIRDCLQFYPNQRPRLSELLFRIEGNLQRLDRQYGGQITARADEAPQELRLQYKRRNEFGIGKDLETCKRRKEEEDERSEESMPDQDYDALIREPAYSKQVDQRVLEEMLRLVCGNVSDRAEATKTDPPHPGAEMITDFRPYYAKVFSRLLSAVNEENAHKPLSDLIGWGRWFSGWMRHQQDSPQDIRTMFDEELVQLNGNQLYHMLELILDNVSELLREGSTDNSPFRDALDSFSNALRLGMFFLNLPPRHTVEVNFGDNLLHLGISNIIMNE